MIINGDSLEVLKTLEDNSVDTVITDPPYGYSFMGKDWDKAVPSVEIWQECLRVLKPGAFMCVMSAPRSDVLSRMIVNIEDAGFRVDFSPIAWTFASGFPKALNIGKSVDKRLGAEREVIGTGRSGKNAGMQDLGPSGIKGGNYAVTTPSTNQAKALDGSYAGFQPKPAVEVVIIAMKPLSEKTYIDQALKNGKGITWLDDCRVPTTENLNGGMYSGGEMPEGVCKDGSGFSRQPKGAFVQPSGRFPANLLVSDDVLNDGVERSSSGGYTENVPPSANVYGKYGVKGTVKPKDSGSYSRYFDLDAWARERLPAEQAMTFPFAIFPKASKSEKNKGLDGFDEKQAGGMQGTHDKSMKTGSGNERNNMARNFHPTVKPLKLMSYLITLFSREGDTVLDPFVGSGTTVVAAEQLGRKGIGIEREAEYAEIARARVEHAKTEDDRTKRGIIEL